MKVVWRSQAEMALEGISEYLLERNPDAVMRIAKTIRQRVGKLGKQPGLGRPGRVPDTRELVITGTPYIVAYTVDKSAHAVIILQVQHSARLWPESFDDGDNEA